MNPEQMALLKKMITRLMVEFQTNIIQFISKELKDKTWAIYPEFIHFQLGTKKSSSEGGTYALIKEPGKNFELLQKTTRIKMIIGC